jgi:hypothetical protein
MTDDEIRRAVAVARSWHGAGRALGLKSVNGGAMRTLKKRVADLGVDTSHFTHQRTWSDEQLRVAVASSTTWTGVLRQVGISERCRESAKRHAIRLALDTTHLDPPCWDIPPEIDNLLPTRSMLSKAGESVAAAWFALRGIPTAVPNQPAAYDLLASFPDGVRRIQVKTTTHRGKQGSWKLGVGRRPYVMDKTASRTSYEPGELDYFFIIDGDGVVYLIPAEVLVGKVGINIGPYRQFAMGDASSLLATSGGN